MWVLTVWIWGMGGKRRNGSYCEADCLLACRGSPTLNMTLVGGVGGGGGDRYVLECARLCPFPELWVIWSCREKSGRTIEAIIRVGFLDETWLFRSRRGC